MELLKIVSGSETTLAREGSIHLAPTGELARLIQGYDWSATYLGPLDAWPMSLRTTVDIMLYSPVPMVLLWGPDGIMLYNDAYAFFAGNRHPQLLGAKVLEGWPEVADFNRNIMDVCYRRGETLSYEGQHLVLYRHGQAEDLWTDLNYGPVLDESRKPAGVLAIVVETTSRILAEKEARAAQDEVLQSEARFRMLADHAPLFVFMAGKDADVTYWNKTWQAYIGQTPETVLAYDWRVHIHPEDLDNTFHAYQAAYQNQAVFTVENRIRDAQTHQYRWFLWRGNPLYLANGTFNGMIGIGVDINDRKQAEIALLESEERFKKMSDSSPYLIWMADKDFVNVSFNKTYRDFIGLPESESINWHNIVPAEDIEAIGKILTASIREQKDFQFEHRLKYRDGSLRWVLASGFARFSPNGEFEGFLGSDVDITPIKEAQTALKESQTFHKIMYEWERTTRETVQRFQQPLPVDEIFKTSLGEISRILNPDRCYAVTWHDVETEATVVYEKRRDQADVDAMAEPPSWATLPFLTHCQLHDLIVIDDLHTDDLLIPIWHDLFAEDTRGLIAISICYQEELLGAIVLQEDVSREWTTQEIAFLKTLTEQLKISLFQARAKAHVERVSQLKSHFLAMMSHELRTPLNAIIGYSEMLGQGIGGTVTDKQLRYIQNVNTSGRHLLTLVNDILDISKIEAGKLEVHQEIVLLEPVLDDLKGIILALASSKDVAMIFDVAPDLQQVYADPIRLRQILLNLLNNAIKFNRSGGQVFLRLKPNANHDQVIFEIEDTGIGIAEDQLPNLFTEFYQADSGHNRHQEGTGLGLALTKNLIALHGGTIRVESKKDVGTKFRFALPINADT